MLVRCKVVLLAGQVSAGAYMLVYCVCACVLWVCACVRVKKCFVNGPPPLHTHALTHSILTLMLWNVVNNVGSDRG